MIRVTHKFRLTGSKIVAGQADPKAMTLHMNLLPNKYKHTPVSLGLCAVTLGNWCPKFRSNLLVSSSRIEMSVMVPKRRVPKSPSDAATHPRETAT